MQRVETKATPLQGPGTRISQYSTVQSSRHDSNDMNEGRFVLQSSAGSRGPCTSAGTYIRLSVMSVGHENHDGRFRYYR